MIMPATQTIRKRAIQKKPIKLFLRQPFTETRDREALIIQGVLDTLQKMNGTLYEFEFLTGRHAQSSETFQAQFERETGCKFSPQNFRRNRLSLIDQADAIVVIRTGLSESTAFEVAYNIFAGPAVPIFFAVWDKAPIKTTLLRDLHEIVPVRYATFSKPQELTEPLLDFFKALPNDDSTENASDTFRLRTRTA